MPVQAARAPSRAPVAEKVQHEPLAAPIDRLAGEGRNEFLGRQGRGSSAVQTEVATSEVREGQVGELVDRHGKRVVASVVFDDELQVLTEDVEALEKLAGTIVGLAILERELGEEALITVEGEAALQDKKGNER